MIEMAVTDETDSKNNHAQLIEGGVAVVDAAQEAGVTVRSLGGVAVALRCESARAPGVLARSYSDLDFVTTFKHVKRVTKVFESLGYEPASRFNATHGESRLLFHLPDGGHVDVFVDRFELCHVLPLRGRLELHPQTVSLADLLLTKLQVAKLSSKDVTDAAALLLDHPLSDDESGINAPYIEKLLAGDWGWWRTSTETIDRLAALIATLGLTAEQAGLVQRRLEELRRRIDDAPKSLRWRTRARIGERRPWREDPDEIEH